MFYYRLFTALLVSILFTGCATYEYHETRANELDRVVDTPDSYLSEESLLDIGIVLFDSGIDEFDDESLAYANVRQSETVWFSEQLKVAFENSNAWGIVRTLPNSNTVFDLTVKGRILESTGEDLRIQVDVHDALGRQWLSKEYFQRVSAYAYNPELDLKRDPFQNLFNDIANDLFAQRTSFTQEELLMIRDVAKIRFAQDFAPEAFADYLELDEDDKYLLRRVPAKTDPMMRRIERIQARNDLFLDVIQDYYRVFNNNMSFPYEEWRKTSYKEVLYQRQLEEQAKQERIAGVAIILSGVLAATGNHSTTTRAAGHVGIAAGADVFAKSYQTEIDASYHAEALREFGESLEIELEPSVVDLQDRTVTLSGTVEDQFKEWRLILKELFEAEQSILNPQEIDSVDSTEAEQLNTGDMTEGVAKFNQYNESAFDKEK